MPCFGPHENEYGTDQHANGYVVDEVSGQRYPCQLQQYQPQGYAEKSNQMPGSPQNPSVSAQHSWIGFLFPQSKDHSLAQNRVDYTQQKSQCTSHEQINIHLPAKLTRNGQSVVFARSEGPFVAYVIEMRSQLAQVFVSLIIQEGSVHELDALTWDHFISVP